MEPDWFGAYGQWAGAIASGSAVLIAISLARSAGKRADKDKQEAQDFQLKLQREANEFQLKLQREADEFQLRIERQAVRPGWHWQGLSWVPGWKGQGVLQTAVFNVGRGPAFKVTAELLETDTERVPIKTKVTVHYLPHSITGEAELVEKATPWRKGISFDFGEAPDSEPIRRGKIRLTWRDRTGYQESEEIKFDSNDEQQLYWVD